MRFADNKTRMRVTLLAFGILRDQLGTTAGPLDLAEGSTVKDLLDLFRTLLPIDSVSSIAVAVNQEYVPATHSLAEGDEVALLPPVSGGAPTGRAHNGRRVPFVRLIQEKIISHDIIPPLERPEDGAVVIFDGVVRNHSQDRRTRYLEYQAYEAMALRQMKALAAQALAEYPIRDVAIVHRLGRIEIGESSVLIAVFSAHRAAAFDACRFLIDTLKKTVPIWKKEFFEDGAVWAQGDPFPAQLTPHATPSAKKKSALPRKAAQPRKRQRAR